MKTFLLITFLSSVAFAVPKRFLIANEVRGWNFEITSESGELGPMQPEWGLDARQVVCKDVPENEKDRIVLRGIMKESLEGEKIEFCDLKPHYKINEIDITDERAAKKKGEDDKKAKLAEILALDGKSSLTKAESDKVLLFLLKERLGK